MIKDITEFKREYPFKSNFLNINGNNLHYIDVGEGDPVVMIHGNPTWSFFYRNVIRKLSQKNRTIALDHIGCGLSDKPSSDLYDYTLDNRIKDLDTLLTKLGITKNITLIVHDWGGMIGMSYAVQNPDKIKKIVITNTAAFLPSDEKKLPFRLKILRNLQPFANIMIPGFNLFAKSALYMAPFKSLSPVAKQGLIAPYNSWKNRIATLKFVLDIPILPSDKSYQTSLHTDKNLHVLSDKPMLICWGKHDFVFDLYYYQEWKKRFPDATTYLFENAGHYLFEDEPEKLNDLLDKFV